MKSHLHPNKTPLCQRGGCFYLSYKRQNSCIILHILIESGLFFFLKACVPPFHLHNGMCLQQCPSGFYSLSTLCLSCHELCRECEGPEDDDCIACPDTSYALYKGRCFEDCPDGTYFEDETKSCRGIPFSVQLVIQFRECICFRHFSQMTLN